MLNTQAKCLRVWVAMLVVAAYSFCVLGPALSFSLSKASIVHSLAEAHGGVLILHIHHNDPEHQNSDQQGPHIGHHCCGVFALPGLSPSDIAFTALEGDTFLVMSEPSDEHALRQPSRLDRPPWTIL
jgi:hypothetical protein